jgi:hypothetical protein
MPTTTERRGHAAAFLGTTPAGLGALAAMIHLVPLAFLRAGLADISAGLADHSRKLAAAGHVAGGEPADGGAVHVELDAAGHRLDVLLSQAGGGAMVAGDRAAVAGIDAGLELLMWHGASENPARRKKWSWTGNPAQAGASKRYGTIQN